MTDIISLQEQVLPKRASRRLTLRLPRSPFEVVSAIVATAFAFLALYPLFRVLARLFWVDGSLDVSAISDAFTQPNLARTVLTTVVIVAVSGSLALAVGGFLAWLNERTDARMGAFTDAMPIVNLLLPSIAGAIGWVFLLSPRAGYINWAIREVIGSDARDGPFTIFSWYGLIFVYTINLVPFCFLLMSAGLRNLDPSLEEQSRMCGGSVFKTLRRVTFPAIRPSILSAAFLVVWAGFGMFSIPAIIAYPAGIDVLSVRIVRLLRFEFPAQTGAAVGLGAFMMVVLATMWWAQKRLLRSQRFSTVSGKGQRATRIKLGKWRPLARLFFLGYIVVAVVLPLLALLLVALHGYWSTNIDWSRISLRHLRMVTFDDSITYQSFKNSLTLATVVATIGMVAAAMISIWIFRSRGKLSRGLDAAIKFPATVSSIVLAVGMILAFSGPPARLAGTLTLLILGYMVLSMPEASVVADGSVGQVGRELSEASHTSGAGGGKTFRRVYLPIMLPGLVAGWALLFVRIVGDVNASALLASTRSSVVGFRILDIYQTGSVATLAAISLVLVIVSAIVLVVVLTVARQLSRWTRGTAGGAIRPNQRGIA